MAENSAKDLLLHDPLSEVTRKQRRLLLAISLLGIAVKKTGLVPTKISALGIEFAQKDQAAIFSILTSVIIYFLLAFLIYAVSDFLAWRRALRREKADNIRERLKLEHEHGSDFTEKEDKEYRKIFPGGYILYELSVPVSVMRAIFEFLFPFLIGGYGAYIVWFT